MRLLNRNSPPATPIKRAVAKMLIDTSSSSSSTPQKQQPSHVRGAKSVDIARLQWEAKIAESQPTKSAAQDDRIPVEQTEDKHSASSTARKVAKRATVYGFSEHDSNSNIPMAASATFAHPDQEQPYTLLESTDSYISPTVDGESLKSVTPSSRSQSIEERLAVAKANALKRRQLRQQEKTVCDTQSSIESSATLSQSQSLVIETRPDNLDSLTQLEKNDTKVRRMKDQAESKKLRESVDTNSQRGNKDMKSMKALDIQKPTVLGTTIEDERRVFATRDQENLENKSIQRAPLTPLASKIASSPFADLFTPTRAPLAGPSTPNTASTPVSRSSLRSIVTPPSAAPMRYVPSGLSSSVTQPLSESVAKPNDGARKYGLISRTDRRKLGRHLPRIASGEKGWNNTGLQGHVQDTLEGERMSATMRKALALTGSNEEKNLSSSIPATRVTIKELPSSIAPGLKTSISRATRPRDIVLAPSQADNHLSGNAAPSTPSKRRSQYMPYTPKSSIPSAIGPMSPRPELTSEDMKGLMSAVGNLPARGTAQEEDDGVTGMSNRLRLNKSRLPPSASSRDLAPAPLPSKRLVQTNWMDKHRHALGSYEYLCHVGEAQQWIEGCLGEELPFGVTEMEERLRDGVVLAKLAKVYEGEEVVRKIWMETKHRYKQSDNINHFLNFVRNVGMPETFIFELTDLYDKKNIPKVIFCIHILSHLLACLGRAERIGNLVGQFEFTNEQIAAAQRGLQGVAMPNFGDVSNTLAKEASWAPTEPEETEEESRDRLLLECEGSVIGLQCYLRGHLVRMSTSRTQAKLELAEPITRRFQARARGALCRRRLLEEIRERRSLHNVAKSIQASARGLMVRQQWRTKMIEVQKLAGVATRMQAQIQGAMTRMRLGIIKKRLRQFTKSIVGFQGHCRSCLDRRVKRNHWAVMAEPHMVYSIKSVQALLRGHLYRQTLAAQQCRMFAHVTTFTSLQSHLRGVLVRRYMRTQEQKMDNAADCIVAIQSVARSVLCRRRKRHLMTTLQQTSPATVSFQSLARARLARQSHKNMQKALAKVEVAGSVGGLQAFLRTRLAKKQTTEQKKKLEFVQPDVIGFQAVARGYIAREDYRFWRDYLHDPKTLGALVFLQSLMRGFNARRRLFLRTTYIHRNIDKIIKIQALWRGRQQRQSYDKLMTGVDVDVSTIQSYMHLLDDTESDFADQVRIEALRGQVVDLIRENQNLETEVKDLDTKIALIINNQMSFQELARAKRRTEPVTYQTPSNDPFSGGVHLDRTMQRKLELYEQLFFMLQTKPEYLSRLLRVLSSGGESAEKNKRMIEGVTMILFAFGHERREEYLFHKLLQLAAHEEILRAQSLVNLVHSRFTIISVTTQYVKPSLAGFIRDVIAPHIMRIISAPDLDLCSDPVKIYMRMISAEETQTGMPSTLPKDRNADQILQEHAMTRAIFIRNLQELRNLTDMLLEDMLQVPEKLPYTIRLLAREALLALQRKFPEATDDELVPVVSRIVILPFILPVVIAPEQYGIAPDGVGTVERGNLSELANLFNHVASQEYMNTPDQRLLRTPLEAFITAMAIPWREWVLDVANVEHAEGHFQAHELFESTIEAKPIKITRADIYGTLSCLIQDVDYLTAENRKDPIVPILEELEGPPIDYDRSKNPVNLRLTNRLAKPQSGGPNATEKADWIQAKRHVLAVLRVQTGKTLFDVLVARPEECHEQMWVEEVLRDIALENTRKAQHGLPPTPVEQEYQIESIRSLPFHEVKSRAIEFCMKLERSGKLSREDHLQGLLVSVASDIRQKHHLRKIRKDNLAGMVKAHEDMTKKRAEYGTQVKAYHDYIDGAMAELQAKGKKKPIFMSKQYRHQMSQKRHGKQAKFGSYKYNAAELYEKRILLSVNQFSPRQFDKLFIIISSNEVGVFSLELSHPTSTTAAGGLLGEDEVRMEDLLGAQYENKERLDMFEGQATFALNMLIHQINKKFYSS
ncbi:uncharacterized protein L203_100455 [Cryptococcus depauperatus CBS 7841]|uniref:IQ domain-containing GTPase activating protein n=1 Tax=Cryptococcus depauperatus CBS 7841 TaxID=1295531 RepID=A0AAJ8JN33_9TREE